MAVLLTVQHASRSEDPYWMREAVPGAYSDAIREQFAATPGCTWDRKARRYRGAAEAIEIPVSTLQAAGVIKVQRLAASPQIPARSTLPNRSVRHQGQREYQLIGVQWLLDMLNLTGSALLCDEMGLGKSLQALQAIDIHYMSAASSITVVCPAVVARHWHTQAARWLPAESNTRVTVISYDKLRSAWARGKAPPPGDAVILDEIHYLSNPRTKRSRTVVEWLADAPVRPLTVGLSGTPIPARVRDLWHPLDVLWPGRFGTRWQFERRYCGGRYEELPHDGRKVWIADGSSRLDELRQRLRHVMLARTKEEVEEELPPLAREVVEVELPAKARRSLASAARAIDWKGEGRQGVAEILSGVESYKVEAAEEIARNAIASGSRPLLLTIRRATAEDLARRLGAALATGEHPAGQRAAILSDERAPAGAATIYAVTTGVDLVSYDVAIMVGLDWVPATLLQGEARLHRIGQRRNVTVYYLVGLGTLDEVVRERVVERLGYYSEVLGSQGDAARLESTLGSGGAEDVLDALFAAAVRSVHQ